MLTRSQIKGAVGQLGWSYARLARETDISANSISAFLRDEKPTNMGIDLVSEIEKVLREAGAEFGDPNWVNVPDKNK